MITWVMRSLVLRKSPHIKTLMSGFQKQLADENIQITDDLCFKLVWEADQTNFTSAMSFSSDIQKRKAVYQEYMLITLSMYVEFMTRFYSKTEDRSSLQQEDPVLYEYTTQHTKLRRAV